MPEPSPRSTLTTGQTTLLVVINMLWAGTSLAAKAALDHVPPLLLAFTRFSLAAILLYAWAVSRQVDLRVRRQDWGLFWGTGLLGITLTYLLSYAGLSRTTAADSALLHASEPVFLIILSVCLLRERLSWIKVIGVAAGLIGVLLITWHGPALQRLTTAASGDLLIACGLLAESLSVIIGKRLVASYPPLSVLTYQMLTGAILLAPGTIWQGMQDHWHLPDRIGGASVWPILGSLLYLVVPCTVFAYAVWYYLLERHAASDLGLLLFVQPVMGALLGIFFQHDTLTLGAVTGAVLVLLALALIRRPVAEADALPPA